MHNTCSQPWIALLRIDKPVGIFLLLWPTLWALWLASSGHVPMDMLIVFLCGVVLMRSAGCVINDLTDRRFDAHVQRTQQRPLATGRLKPHHAMSSLAVLLTLAATLLLWLPPKTQLLALTGLLLTFVYPWCKRFLALPQAVLGLAFAWSIPMAFSALNKPLDLKCWSLFFIAALWPVAYDSIYALVDRDDDLRIGVRSSAITFGCHAHQIIMLIQSIVVAGWGLVCWQFQLPTTGIIGVLIGLIFIHDLKKHLVRNTRDSFFQGFLRQHWLGAAWWLCLVIAFI
jgi:4-hydroxybenzoate polyprenyltransferase